MILLATYFSWLISEMLATSYPPKTVGVSLRLEEKGEVSVRYDQWDQDVVRPIQTTVPANQENAYTAHVEITNSTGTQLPVQVTIKKTDGSLVFFGEITVPYHGGNMVWEYHTRQKKEEGGSLELTSLRLDRSDKVIASFPIKIEDLAKKKRTPATQASYDISPSIAGVFVKHCISCHKPGASLLDLTRYSETFGFPHLIDAKAGNSPVNQYSFRFTLLKIKEALNTKHPPRPQRAMAEVSRKELLGWVDSQLKIRNPQDP